MRSAPRPTPEARSRPRRARPALTGKSSTADVAVIGLGAMGALSAWRFAAQGARVIGFERHRPGHDRGSSHGDTRIFRTAYFESPEYVPLLQRAYVLWRQLEKESGAELLTITGGLAIGPPDGELVPGVLAVVEDDAGFLRAERSVAAAAARAEQLGATLMVDTEVIAVEASGNSVVVETSRGTFGADRVVVAAGAWTSKLLPQLSLPLIVERQVMVWLDATDPAAFAPQHFPIFIREVPDGRFRYGFPTLDGRSIKVGIHHEGSDADPDSIDREVHPADVEPVRDFAREHLHGVTGNVLDARVCMYTNAPDERFMVVRHASLPSVTILSACSGHGFKFASVMGELVAGSVLEDRDVPAIIHSA